MYLLHKFTMVRTNKPCHKKGYISKEMEEILMRQQDSQSTVDTRQDSYQQLERLDVCVEHMFVAVFSIILHIEKL